MTPLPGKDDDLLSDDELRAMQAEAGEILAQPVKKYDYRDPSYKGGPRKLTDEEALAAIVELAGARMVNEELKDRLMQAKVFLLDLCQEQIDNGVPMSLVAEHSGYKHRSSLYRDLAQLPAMKAKLNAAADLQAQIRKRYST